MARKKSQISGKLKLLLAVLAFAFSKYEYEKLNWCRAHDAYRYERDLIIADDAPCNSRNDVYAERLDCKQVRRDIDPDLRAANVRLCWWESQPIHSISWTTTLLLVVVGLLALRYFVYSQLALRKTKIKADTMRQTFRDFHRPLRIEEVD